jgi:hypothetical protein
MDLRGQGNERIGLYSSVDSGSASTQAAYLMPAAILTTCNRIRMLLKVIDEHDVAGRIASL